VATKLSEQLRIGAEMAALLPEKMSQSAVARKLGVSQQYIGRAEKLALYKLRVRWRAALSHPESLSDLL
jgi:hypothetical protein